MSGNIGHKTYLILLQFILDGFHLLNILKFSVMDDHFPGKLDRCSLIDGLQQQDKVK